MTYHSKKSPVLMSIVPYRPHCKAHARRNDSRGKARRRANQDGRGRHVRRVYKPVDVGSGYRLSGTRFLGNVRDRLERQAKDAILKAETGASSTTRQPSAITTTTRGQRSSWTPPIGFVDRQIARLGGGERGPQRQHRAKPGRRGRCSREPRGDARARAGAVGGRRGRETGTDDRSGPRDPQFQKLDAGGEGRLRGSELMALSEWVGARTSLAASRLAATRRRGSPSRFSPL